MRGAYWSFWLAERLANGLPSGSAFRCAERLADVQWQLSAKDRSAVAANLSLVLGQPVSERSTLVRDVFRNFGRYLVEFFTFHRVSEPQITLEGYEHLVDARRGGHGVIAITAHVGNWELAGGVLCRQGMPLTAVALPHHDPRLNRLFNRQRARFGVRVLPLGAVAARHSLQALRAGHLLGVLCDRAFTSDGVPVMFCGREVTFPHGPALLSLRSRTPAVPTFLVREDQWTFRLCIEPPIWPHPEGSPAASVRSLTQRYAAVLERYLKRFPSQWLMFQPITAPVVLNP